MREGEQEACRGFTAMIYWCEFWLPNWSFSDNVEPVIGYDAKIDLLPISSRARKAIWRALREDPYWKHPVPTLYEAMTLTERHLMHTKNCGVKTIKEIMDVLAKYRRPIT